jgi:hypothetical protein
MPSMMIAKSATIAVGNLLTFSRTPHTLIQNQVILDRYKKIAIQ